MFVLFVTIPVAPNVYAAVFDAANQNGGDKGYAGDMGTSAFVAAKAIQAEVQCKRPRTFGGLKTSPGEYELSTTELSRLGLAKVTGRIPTQLKLAAQAGRLFELSHAERTFDTEQWGGKGDVDAWCTAQYRHAPDATGVFTLKTRCGGTYERTDESTWANRPGGDPGTTAWQHRPYRYLRAYCWPVHASVTGGTDETSDVLDGVAIKARILTNPEIQLGTKEEGTFSGSPRPALSSAAGKTLKTGTDVFTRLQVFGSSLSGRRRGAGNKADRGALIGVQDDTGDDGEYCGACLQSCLQYGYMTEVPNFKASYGFQAYRWMTVTYTGLYYTCQSAPYQTFSSTNQVNPYRLARRRRWIVTADNVNNAVRFNNAACPTVSAARVRYKLGPVNYQTVDLGADAGTFEDPILHSLVGYCQEIAAATYTYIRPWTGFPLLSNGWLNAAFVDFARLEFDKSRLLKRSDYALIKSYYPENSMDWFSKPDVASFSKTWLLTCRARCLSHKDCDAFTVDTSLPAFKQTLESPPTVSTVPPKNMYYAGRRFSREWFLLKDEKLSCDGRNTNFKRQPVTSWIPIETCKDLCSSYKFMSYSNAPLCDCSDSCDIKATLSVDVAIYNRSPDDSLIGDGWTTDNFNQPTIPVVAPRVWSMISDGKLACDGDNTNFKRNIITSWTARDVCQGLCSSYNFMTYSDELICDCSDSCDIKATLSFRVFIWMRPPNRGYNGNVNSLSGRWPFYGCHLLQIDTSRPKNACAMTGAATSSVLLYRYYVNLKYLTGRTRESTYQQSSYKLEYNLNPACSPGNAVYAIGGAYSRQMINGMNTANLMLRVPDVPFSKTPGPLATNVPSPGVIKDANLDFQQVLSHCAHSCAEYGNERCQYVSYKEDGTTRTCQLYTEGSQADTYKSATAMMIAQPYADDIRSFVERLDATIKMAKDTDEYDFMDFLLPAAAKDSLFTRMPQKSVDVSNSDQGGPLRLCLFQCLRHASKCQAVSFQRSSGATSKCHMYTDDGNRFYAASPGKMYDVSCSSSFDQVSSFYECVLKCMPQKYMVYSMSGSRCQCAESCGASTATFAGKPATTVVYELSPPSDANAIINRNNYYVEHPAVHMNARIGIFECAWPCKQNKAALIQNMEVKTMFKFPSDGSAFFKDAALATLPRVSPRSALQICKFLCQNGASCIGFELRERYMRCDLHNYKTPGSEHPDLKVSDVNLQSSGRIWTYVVQQRTSGFFAYIGKRGHVCSGVSLLDTIPMPNNASLSEVRDEVAECEQACLDYTHRNCGSFALEPGKCRLYTACPAVVGGAQQFVVNNSMLSASMGRFYHVLPSQGSFVHIKNKNIKCAKHALYGSSSPGWDKFVNGVTLLQRCADACQHSILPVQSQHSGCVGFTIDSMRRCSLYTTCDSIDWVDMSNSTLIHLSYTLGTPDMNRHS
jgi:hypothetical protein